jgi:hypothetical protein
MIAFANAASTIGQTLIQLGNELRDSANAPAHTQAAAAAAAAAPVVDISDGIQRRIKISDEVNEVISVLNMLRVPLPTIRGMFGFAKSEQVTTKSRTAFYNWDASKKLAAVSRAKRWFESTNSDDDTFVWPKKEYEAWQTAHGAGLLAETGSSGSSLTGDASNAKKRALADIDDDGEEDYDDAANFSPPPPPQPRASSASKLQPAGAGKHQTRSASLEPTGRNAANANSKRDAPTAALPKPVEFEDADDSVRVLYLPRAMMRHFSNPNEWNFSITADDVPTARYLPNPIYSITFSEQKK